ncbi:MAG: hypothetical protein M0P20_05975 [Methanocorpusculum sp.]|nr:hypothetical protein [Methanocorpusculum sp.]
MNKMIVIPDTSFFVCFIDDLADFVPENDRYQYLNVISTVYQITVTPEVRKETSWNRVPEIIQTQCYYAENILSPPTVDPIIEQLRLLLGKGEIDVISYSNMYKREKIDDFKFVLDDGMARKLVSENLPILVTHMVGTVGLLKICALEKIYDKVSIINILENIKVSKFRIQDDMVCKIIIEIKESGG